MTESSPIGPKPPKDWPACIDHLREGFAGQLNVYRTMAHHPDLLNSWQALRGHVVMDNALGFERLEVAILRIAARLGSRYEWEHHVNRAKTLGFSQTRIHSLRGKTDDMVGDDRIITQAVDALIDCTRLPPSLLADVTQMVGTKGVLDLMATVGFYKTLGCIVETFDVPMDDLIVPPNAPVQQS